MQLNFMLDKNSKDNYAIFKNFNSIKNCSQYHHV